MKNFKLTLCDAFLERLTNLASLEESALFQDVYLDALREGMTARTRLRRSSAKPDDRSFANCASGCRIQNA